MKSEKLEVVRGSGNVFRDLGHANADVEQLKAILAAEIIKGLHREHLTVRAAHSRTGIAAADFSRIRNADLGRFTAGRGKGPRASRGSYPPPHTFVRENAVIYRAERRQRPLNGRRSFGTQGYTTIRRGRPGLRGLIAVRIRPPMI